MALSIAPAAADETTPGWNKLVYIMYRLEVTDYCGLTTAQVVAGYRQRRDAHLATAPLAAALVANARTEAYKLAYREWDNRGLGGFRRWCREDATRYANYFAQAADN